MNLIKRKKVPRLLPGAQEDHVLGHVIVTAFELMWVGEDGVEGAMTVEGLLPFLHIASDGQVLVRLRGSGGLRLYVPKTNIVEFRPIKPSGGTNGHS